MAQHGRAQHGRARHGKAGHGHQVATELEGLALGPDLATLRARFEREPVAAALAAGTSLTIDQALDEALTDVPLA